MPTDQILIIGAGPYGLSVSAHLRRMGVDHRIVGRPMSHWREHMPVGMMLRSEPYGSDLAAPSRGFDVASYSALNGLDYVDRLGPLSAERFLDYSAWYVDRLVPDVEELTATEISPAGAGFRVSFAEGDPVTAARVVVATGILPFAALPDELAGLPADLVTHTSAHHDLSRFAGRRVAVVGGGQSALETAALLHEAGADTRVVMRGKGPNWLTPNPERISRLGQLRRPVNKLCEGWHCSVWNTPAVFRRLPQDLRVTKARTVLGPAGAWWLKDRVEGVVEVIAGHQVRGAVATGSGVRLQLEGPRHSTLDVDHVVAGTGFRVDLARLPFMTGPVLSRVETVNGYPVVNRVGESTLPGLYFAGAPTVVSLGPSMRFIAGTHNITRLQARDLAAHAGARRGTGLGAHQDGAGHAVVDAA